MMGKMSATAFLSGLMLLTSPALANEKIEVARLLSKMESRDYREVSEAAREARQYAYSEVADKLLDLLGNEDVSDENASYAFVVSHALDSLREIGRREHQERLRRVQTNIYRIVLKTPHEMRLTKLVGLLLEDLNARPGHLGPVPGAQNEPEDELKKARIERFGRRINRDQANAEEAKRVRMEHWERQQNKPEPIVARPMAADQNIKDNELRPERQNLPPAQERLPLSELIEGLNLDARELAYLQKYLLNAIENNLYDQAVSDYNSDKPIVEYKFRDDDLERLLQAILRRDKGHALLTGKAGVGKTTLLKMLQQGWVSGELSYPGANIPLVLELSILDITNPQDPSAIKERIKAAQMLAQRLNTHIILFVDEAHVATSLSRNAIKAFLSESIDETRNLVHFVWATTSTESRAFVSDTAFSRRWVEINVKEFTNAQAIEAVRTANMEIWRKTHARKNVQFEDVTEDAWAYAIKYRNLEQPYAGNPTGLKELIEGAIVYRMRELEKNGDAAKFVIDPEDIRGYLKFQKGLKLIPGDGNFDAIFEEMWGQFRIDYQGQDGAMIELKRWLRSHFATLERPMMLVIADFGPPGAGKSFSSEMIAKHFFDGAILDINAGMFSEGDFPLNVLIGSPTGTVGSEEQRSILTNFIRKYPNGGVINIEEADYLPQQVMDFLIDMITKKKFTDGLGQEWSTENFIIKFNTNMGQELLVRPDGRTRMTWQDFEMRRNAITHKVRLEGDKEVKVVRPEKLDEVFNAFIAKISQGRNGHKETAEAQRNGLKLKRRIKSVYSLLPDREELRNVGHQMVQRYLEDKKREYGVTFKIDAETIDGVLDLDAFRFEEGYSYIQARLSNFLFFYLDHMLDREGRTITVKLGARTVQIGRRSIESKVLILNDGREAIEHSLGTPYGATDNQWFNNEQMRERIRNFAGHMGGKIKGQREQVLHMATLYREKLMDWNTKLNLTQLGTSGNGKTEFGYALAEALYGTREAAYKISGLNTWADLQNHFRSPVGFVGSNEETEFERWFMARKNAGGGIIILDELLSLSNLSPTAIEHRMEILNKLYDLLDERIIRFKNRTEDARAFTVVITGNLLQELFEGIDDSPEAEQMVKRILERVSTADVTEYLKRYGVDAPKQSRLGRIFINGPLPKSVSYEVGLKDLQRSIDAVTHEMSQLFDIQVDIDPQIVQEIVDRVTTVKLGMRFVNAAINSLIKSSVAGILIDIDGGSKIKASLSNGRLAWKVDGADVERVAIPIKGTADFEHRWTLTKHIPPKATVSTPQLTDVEVQPKVRMTDEQLRLVGVHEIYGHWMTSVLLFGRNDSQTISLIPNQRALGFVAEKTDKPIDIQGLARLLGEIAVLEAGHRAVFLEGVYAMGGGNNGRPRDRQRAPTDDLGRVDQTLHTILSNNLLDGFTEFGKASEIEFFKEFMRNVGKAMADQVITYGRANPVFNQAFDEILAKRFAGEETLDAYAARALQSATDSDLVMMQALSNAVRLAVSKASHKVKARALGRELLNKVSTELIASFKLRGQKNPAKEKKLKALSDKASEDLDALKGTKDECEGLLVGLGEK